MNRLVSAQAHQYEAIYIQVRAHPDTCFITHICQKQNLESPGIMPNQPRGVELKIKSKEKKSS